MLVHIFRNRALNIDALTLCVIMDSNQNGDLKRSNSKINGNVPESTVNSNSEAEGKGSRFSLYSVYLLIALDCVFLPLFSQATGIIGGMVK